MACYDLDGDGVEELVTGWSSGKVDARNSRTGEVVFRDVLNHAVAGVLTGDYTQSGRPQILACSQAGEGKLLFQSSNEFLPFRTYIKRSIK